MPAGGMWAASRQRYRSPRRRLTRCLKQIGCWEKNGAGVIIDEQVSYPGRPAQKKLLQPEKLSGDGRDIACTTQVVQGLASTS